MNAVNFTRITVNCLLVCSCVLVVSINDARSICNYCTCIVCSLVRVSLNCPRFYYSVHCTRRTPYISGCAKSGDVTTIFFLHQYSVQCLHSYYTQKLSSYRPNLFQTAKCLVRVTAFPDNAETPSRKDFCAMMY